MLAYLKQQKCVLTDSGPSYFARSGFETSLLLNTDQILIQARIYYDKICIKNYNWKLFDQNTHTQRTLDSSNMKILYHPVLGASFGLPGSGSEFSLDLGLKHRKI